MNQYFGWVQVSDMPLIYVHISYGVVYGAFLKLHGFKQNGKEEKDTISPKKCYRCEKSNPPTGKFCLRCGAPLNLETVIKTEEQREEMDNVMSLLLKEMLNEPEIQRFITSKLKEVKIETQ